MTSILLFCLLVLLDLGLSMDPRNHTGMRRLVKKKKFLQGNVDRFGYLGSDVVDYNIVDGPLTGYSYQYPEVVEEEEGARDADQEKRSLFSSHPFNLH